MTERSIHEASSPTSSPQLVDIGANLTNKSFSSDLDAVLERARSVGVTQLVVTGTSVEESRAASELASTRAGQLFSTAGVHPHHAKDGDERTIPILRELAAQAHVVAIGECGLDFNRDFSPRPVQLEWFRKQVELAIELAMPLFLHERDASGALLEILRPLRDSLPPAVVHCFTGEESALDDYLELDLHIGITGWICDERRGSHLHGLVSRIPADRLMIESDAPYLQPRTLRPRPKTRRNEPATLPAVLETLSSCLDRSPLEVAAATTATARRFFGLDS